MDPDRDLFVVGVGSSAGGIEALEGLFRPMPATSGMAFVLVSHLAPDRESKLHEIVGRFTRMPVRQAVEGVTVEADHVYVIPPDAMLRLADGKLRVVSDQQATKRRPANPIDTFLTSLAKDRGERAVGILLSGGGSDGTIGCRAIKEAGGLTLAQGSDHSAPLHASMPASAIGAGAIDIVAPVEEMPERLLAYVANFGKTLPEVQTASAPPPAEEAVAVRQEICAILREQAGHDFSGYKERTFLRRVQRRMQVLQLVRVEDYIQRLRRDPDEVKLLFRDLLIGVTTFFRDADAFKELAATVVPELLAGKGAGDTVRVWVPGCATGEEVYSIAILLREQLGGQPSPPKVQIFGTDIDDGALTQARAGCFAPAALEAVTPERRRRFFTEDAGLCLIAKEVRDMCIFSTHSLIRDPPFSRLDLISCRNLLIYFDAELQALVLPMFHYALRPGGYLFLGIAENISPYAELFAALDRKQRIFRRRDRSPGQVPYRLLLAGTRTPAQGGARRQDVGPVATTIRRNVDARVLEGFAPAHVVVDREGEVLYYSLRTGKFLEQPAGTPVRQLLAMARTGLRPELRAALTEAAEKGRGVSREPVLVETDERVQPIRLTVEPMGDQGAEGLFLVLFTELGTPLAREQAPGGGTPVESETARLEAELRDSRERLQATIEENETALEELRVANEELVSMNEELQSANEELETSKEESQSINEELQTVNQELRVTIEQLNRTSGDLTNLFDSTEIAVIFLDRDMVIRSFTPSVTELFSLIPNDQGRPLTDIVTNLAYDGLAADVRQVIDGGEPLSRRVSRRDGKVHFTVRVLPYRTGSDEPSGALITFVDVTGPVQAEQQQRLLVHELNHRVRNMLAVVSAIATQTMGRTPEPELFAENFLRRVQALARSHALVARDGWGDVGLEELVRGEVAPHTDGGPDRVRFGGPPILLKPKAALALGMVAHELATNALKHGALSTEGGRVQVAWAAPPAKDGLRRLVLTWQETGGPAATPNPSAGFGTMVIDRTVRHELGGTVTSDLKPEGLTVTIDLPVDPLLIAAAGDQPRGS